MLTFYDYCFTIFHSAFILFVLFGWIHPKTRKAHYLAILLTIIAWLILGLWVGTLGYCPLTDWQWEIKNQLGYRGLPNSFTEYVLEKILNTDLNTTFVDILTLLGLIFGVAMAIVRFVQGRFATKKS